ncbi:CHAT domain-containing protein [Paraburkholderia sp. CNPSo 3272]|uniref:CHAT domain-containing protein n=1 Tax=Paraburkholderia sp. CNPSo 3272 TaxID=2940931 RepID=UPI0020B63C45|nr:CHAT domain-containing protein [Paraburkholderia sp. CNPSo 3272]MCP3728465.1 CHAT domain-containing protein [Paraburkholderia sp. CNPSo 3272]
MKDAPRTDVLIHLEPLQAGRALLRFKLLTSGATKDFVLHDVDRRIQAINDDLPHLLQEFRIAVSPPGTVQLDAARMTKAFDRLKWLAYGMLDLLLEQSDCSPARFVTSLSAFLTPVTIASGKRNGAPPVIELSADDAFPLAWHLPLELIPLVQSADATAPRKPGAASPNDFLAYLGMSAVIVRRRRPDGEASREKASKTPLSVVAFRGNSVLPGIEAQLSYFRSKTALIDAHTLWPGDDPPDECDAVSELADILLQPQKSRSAPDSPRPVVHFCCHYRAGGAGALAELEVSDGLGVRIVDLRGALAQHEVPDATVAGLPLVFLNACTSASLNPRDDSLLRLLIRRGYCHVIGGETLLPDRIAGEFATRVYRDALRGRPIGMAIWRARRYLLERFNNPGGLLYTLYGSPDIRLH